MKKIVVCALAVVMLPVVLVGHTIVSWGMAESRVQQNCVESQMLAGYTESQAQNQCW